MWYDKYKGFPFKHLGNNPETGIDCFNLCRLIYQNELGIEIDYTTSDFCNIVDEDWFSKTHDRYFEKVATKEYGWKKVTTPQTYDIILMSIGSTNITNHCALYLGNNKIIHTLIGHNSWVSTYGNYYKQYTTGIARWIGLNN